MKKQLSSFRKTFVYAVITLISLSLVGCSLAKTPAPSSSSTAGTSQSSEKKPVKIRAIFGQGMTGIGNQFGIAHDFYKKAGIELESVQSTDPAATLAAFVAGKVDIAEGDPGTFAPAAANGVPFKIVGNMWRSTGAYWIIANPSIKSWADLKGKPVGTGMASGGMRVTTMEVLSKNGVDPKDVKLIANGVYQTAYSSLVSGQVVATIIHQPFATIAEKEGTGHVLGKTWDYVTDYDTGAIVASDDIIKNRPDDLQRALEVYYQANEYARTQDSEFYPWAAKYLNISEELTKEAITSEKNLWTNDPIVDANRLTSTEKLLVKYGYLDKVLAINEVVNNTFAVKAAQNLKLGKYR